MTSRGVDFSREACGVTDECVVNVRARADNMIQIRKDKREEAMLKKRRWARARDERGRGRRRVTMDATVGSNANETDV